MEDRKIYVGNFPFSWKEEDIENVFNEFRDKISEIKIIYDQYSKRSKGFAFVTFEDNDTANKALSKSQVSAGDRTLIVSMARPAGAKKPFGGNNRGGDRPSRNNSEGRFDRGFRNTNKQRNDFDDY